MTEGYVPMDDDDFKERPLTGLIESLSVGQTEYNDGGMSTLHEAGCTYDSGWSCGTLSGCTDEPRNHLRWVIDRDDKLTSYEREAWEQNDPCVDTKGNAFQRSMYDQNRRALKAGFKEMGGTLDKPEDFKDAAGKRASFKEIKRDGESRFKAKLLFLGFEEE